MNAADSVLPCPADCVDKVPAPGGSLRLPENVPAARFRDPSREALESLALCAMQRSSDSTGAINVVFRRPFARRCQRFEEDLSMRPDLLFSVGPEVRRHLDGIAPGDNALL